MQDKSCDCGHPKYHHIKTGVEHPPCRSCDCEGYALSVNVQAVAVAAKAKAPRPS